MAVNTKLKSLTITNGTLKPSFSPDIFEYTFYFTGSKDTSKITVTSQDNMSRIEIQNKDTGKLLGQGFGEATTESFLIQGVDNIYIYSSGVTGAWPTVYKITMSISKGKWPIREQLLRPGFYGGSYIPNYRIVKQIYTIGSGEFDYERDYNLKEPVNQEAIDWMNTKISKFTERGKLDAIVESFIHYSGFINSNWPDDGDFRYYLPVIQVSSSFQNQLIDGYIPKNNKLYSYPYNSIEIIGYGQNSELRFETFKNPKQPIFGIISKFTPGASVQLYPLDYEGLEDNFDAGCTGDSLPILPYTKDQYLNDYNAGQNQRIQSQIAMKQDRNFNRVSVGLSAMSAGLSAGALLTDTLSGAGGANRTYPVMNSSRILDNAIINPVINYQSGEKKYHQGLAAMVSELKDVVNRPSSITNQNATPSIPALVKDGICPFVVKKSVRKVFLEKIDEFFSRYGYKVTKFKEVDINTRPVFNFLKCSQARVDGSIPQEDLITIKGILEKGITFWHDPTKILDYSVDNSAPIK